MLTGWVSEWVSSFLTAHQHIIGYFSALQWCEYCDKIVEICRNADWIKCNNVASGCKKLVRNSMVSWMVQPHYHYYQSFAYGFISRVPYDFKKWPSRRLKATMSDISSATSACCVCAKCYNEPPVDSWTQCPLCHKWFHDSRTIAHFINILCKAQYNCSYKL